MKVEEAKKHGCVKDPNNQACMANWCMAWRWNIEEIPKEEDQYSKRVSFLLSDFRLSTTDGYCGLAGKEGAE